MNNGATPHDLKAALIPNSWGSINISSFGLKTLEGLPIPRNLKGSFICAGNDLTDFKNFPNFIGVRLGVVNNPIVTLSGIHDQIHHVKTLIVPDTIRSSMLGLLLIDGLDLVGTNTFSALSSPTFHQAMDIINRHLKLRRDVLACQEELIDVGLEEFAQL